MPIGKMPRGETTNQSNRSNQSNQSNWSKQGMEQEVKFAIFDYNGVLGDAYKVYADAYSTLQSFRENNFTTVLWTSQTSKQFPTQAYKKLFNYIDFFEFCEGRNYQKHFDQFASKYEGATKENTLIFDDKVQKKLFGFQHAFQVNTEKLTTNRGYHLKEYSNYDFKGDNEVSKTDNDIINQWTYENGNFVVDTKKQTVQPYYAYPLKERIHINERTNEFKKIQQIAGLQSPTDIHNTGFNDRDKTIIDQAKRILQYGKNRDLYYSPKQDAHPQLETYKVQVARMYAEYKDPKSKRYRNAMDIGLNTLKRYMRTLVLPNDGTVKELDLKSAHQAIIKCIAEKVNTREANSVASTMKEYIDNKKQHMQDVVEATGCTQEQAKELFLLTTYGGCVNTWVKQCTGHIDTLYNPDKNIYQHPTKFSKSYWQAMKTVKNIFKSHSSINHIYEICEQIASFKEKDIPEISAISLVAQTIEREIAHFIINYVSTLKKASPEGYAYDGLFYKDTVIQSINFQHLQQKIKDKFAIEIKLDVKPLDPDSESKEHIEELIENYSPETIEVAKRDLLSELNEGSPPTEYNTAVIIAKIIEDSVLINEHCDFYGINEHGMLDFIANFKDGTHNLQSMFYKRLDAVYNSTKKEIQQTIQNLTERFNEENNSDMKKLLEQQIKEMKEQQKLVKQYKTKWGSFQFLQNSIKALTNLEDVRCSNLDNVLDKNNRYLGFNNGVLDLISFEFYDYCPEGVYICSRCDYDYYPQSDVSKETFENYQWAHQFIESLQQTKEEADALKRYLSMAALRGAIKGHHNLGLFIGPGGRNGKGIITNDIIPRVIPQHYGTMATSSLQPSQYSKDRANPDMYRLKNNRIAMVHEASEIKLDVNTLKQISGGDPIEARRMFCNTESIQPDAQLLLLCNDIPSYTQTDSGIKERSIPFKFPFQFLEKDNIKDPTREFEVDTTIPQKIERCGPLPFLHMLMDGLKDFYQKGGLALPIQIRERKEGLLQSMNPIRAWIVENVQKCQKSFVKRQTLLDAICEDPDSIPEDCLLPTKDGFNHKKLSEKLTKEMNNALNSQLVRKRDGNNNRIRAFDNVKLLQNNKDVYGTDTPDMPPATQKKDVPEYEPRYEPPYPGTTTNEAVDDTANEAVDDNKSNDTANFSATTPDDGSDDTANEGPVNDINFNKTPQEKANANLPDWIKQHCIN